MLRPISITAALLVLGFAPSASATPPVYVPWPCNVSYRVTQGHGGGSHADDINRWAWDFGIPVGADVVAPADGIVRAVRMNSTSGGCDASFVNGANYVVIDFQDGTDANFTHLQANSSNLTVGSPVKRGDVVGKVGLTGWVCGAHLHFQFQNTCNSAACNSVQTDFVEFGDPVNGTTIVSNNCPAGPCGLAVDPATPLTIDEKDESCFERITSYFWLVRQGDGGHHYWTYTATAPDPETIGRYHFSVAEAGTYQVEVFIPDGEITSTRAVYTIESGGGSTPSAPFDQAANRGWHALGVFDFAVGPSAVALTDNTGEDAAKLAFDSIRLTWVPPPPVPEPDPQQDVGVTPDLPDAGPGASPDASGTGDAGDPGGPQVIESRGSACSSAAGRPKSWPLLFALFAVLRRRRR